MKNLKTLNRKELKNVLGGATLACEAPVDGGCSKPGYIFCSNPYCCYPPNKPFICLD
ncbi:bacteriocin-like protein [Chryseobacterium sp. SN22]|uniref:bacteriocin-like protein n=1 Tax=Chryseobacterium sp. SN22 TaxID=2606431 RepID=UPI0039772F5E